jgi:hypothetical protein
MGETYLIHGSPFFDSDGSPLILEIGFKTTGLERAKEELRKAKE